MDYHASLGWRGTIRNEQAKSVSRHAD